MCAGTVNRSAGKFHHPTFSKHLNVARKVQVRQNVHVVSQETIHLEMPHFFGILLLRKHCHILTLKWLKVI